MKRFFLIIWCITIGVLATLKYLDVIETSWVWVSAILWLPAVIILNFAVCGVLFIYILSNDKKEYQTIMKMLGTKNHK